MPDIGNVVPDVADDKPGFANSVSSKRAKSIFLHHSHPSQFPTGVTSVRHIQGVRGEDAPDHVLCEPLRHFRGLVAVGTVGGVVFCADLMLDQPVDAEEALPAELFLVSNAMSYSRVVPCGDFLVY